MLATVAIWVIQLEADRVESELLDGFQRRALLEARKSVNPVAFVPVVKVPSAVFESDRFHGVTMPEAAEIETWREPLKQFAHARDQIYSGKMDDAAGTLNAILEVPGIEQIRTISGLPLVPLVLRAQLDCVDRVHARETAEALFASAFAYPSPISERLIEDAAQWVAGEVVPGLGCDRSDAWMERRSLLKLLQQPHGAVALPREGASVAGKWSREVPWKLNNGDWWFADFDRDFNHVSIVALRDIEAVLQTREQELSTEFEGRARFRVDWVPAGGKGQDQSGVIQATEGQLRVRVILDEENRWRAPIEERVRELQWRFGWIALVVGGVCLGGWWLLRQKLRMAELESNFIASVSHELRTPVASIGVLAERLQSGKVTDGEELKDYHQMIAREGKRLSALIDNVLDFSRIEGGRQRYESEEVDLEWLVTETVGLLQPKAEEKGVQLRESIDLENGRAAIVADGLAIRQMMVNLIDNAIKFTPSGGDVEVTVNDCGERQVEIRVVDTGCGIPRSERKRVFDRFYRVDNGLTRESTGAGIGLSIVEHIVEAHDGRIELKANEPTGTEIRVTLPNRREPDENTSD